MARMLAFATEQTHVLVVDSRPQDYLQLAAESAASGLVFQFATTGSDALKLRRTTARSIWLVNINLPDGSGCELAAAIRARDPRSVVYLIGDHYTAAEELQSRMVGGAMYVCKPADVAWLDQVNAGGESSSAALCRCA